MKAPMDELITKLVYHGSYEMKVSEIIEMIEPYLEKDKTMLKELQQAKEDNKAMREQISNHYQKIQLNKTQLMKIYNQL